MNNASTTAEKLYFVGKLSFLDSLNPSDMHSEDSVMDSLITLIFLKIVNKHRSPSRQLRLNSHI